MDDFWSHLPSDDEPKAEQRFKWGWNTTNGATVWEVGGPVDGLPAHNEALLSAWGRLPDVGVGGDVLGFAEWTAPELWIHAYFEADVPAAVVEHFRTLLPAAEIVLAR